MYVTANEETKYKIKYRNDNEIGHHIVIYEPDAHPGQLLFGEDGH